MKRATCAHLRFARVNERTKIATAFVAVLVGALLFVTGAQAGSLRFFGNGASAPTLDRAVIRLDAPARPVDVGGADFTLEFWLRALPGENPDDSACGTERDAWIYGHIAMDRDVDGPGDFGDYGVSVMNRSLAFGLSVGSAGATACGSSVVDDGAWHHVALTRRASDGLLRIFLDGQPEANVPAPSGNSSYRDGRGSTAFYDPFLVIGAEKHDYPTLSYSGWIDEVRISTSVRYSAAFTRPHARSRPTPRPSRCITSTKASAIWWATARLWSAGRATASVVSAGRRPDRYGHC